MAQGSERRIVTRRVGNRLSNWQEDVEDISLIQVPIPLNFFSPTLTEVS
jgi:hypothetical protein